VHKVVSALRDGSLGTRFQKVITVGHSLGSLTVAQEAGQFKDVDALITTGFLHTINYLNVAVEVLGRDYPAMSDPKFAGSISDPLFLTNVPGTRYTFYNKSNVDPAVVAADEQLKAADSLVDFATAAAFNVDNVDRDLNIPVLVVTGDHDVLFCGIASQDCGSADQLIEHERPWYGPSATIEAFMPPNTGHDAQLERTAPLSTQAMLAFSDRHIGHGTGATGTTPGARPAIPAPPPTQPSPVAAAAGAAFTKTVLPLANAYADAVRNVPGLGDTSNPAPGANEILSTIANLVNQTLGSLPPELIGAL
jgi:pimeloyl-ACP methyl ester carboxylesterase